MNYNALQVTGRKRYSYGLEFIAAYTFSKTMSDNLGYYGAGGGSLATQSAYWQNAYDRHADYGLAFFDVTHNFNLGGVFDLPYGKGRAFGKDAPKAVDWILGGWQLGYNFNIHSGFPITITSPNNSNAGNRTERSNHYRPLVLMNQTIDNWFGTDPSARPCPASGDNGTCAYGQALVGTFGNSSIAAQRAPIYKNFDATIGKNFHFTERQYLQFRAELFNAFNMVSFGSPSNNASAANFGQITVQANSPRVIQFALKYYF